MTEELSQVVSYTTKTTVVVNDLLPSTNYIAEVKAEGGSGFGYGGPWSPALEFTTITDITPPVKVVLNGSAQGSSMEFQWTNPWAKEDGRALQNFKEFELRFYPAGDPSRTHTINTTSLQYVLTVEENAAMFGDAQHTVTLEVIVWDQVGNESEAAIATVSIPALPAPVLTARGSTGNIYLSWTLASGHPQRYEIYRNGAKIAGVAGEDSAFNDSEAPRGSNTYFVRAYDPFGRSVDSNEVEELAGGYFEEDFISPKAPTNASGTSSMSYIGERRALATVAWDAPTQNVDDTGYDDPGSFEVRYRISSDRPWSYITRSDDRADGTTPQRVELEIPRIVPGARLYWGVRAIDRYGNRSVWLTHEFDVVVDDVPPSTPTGVTAEGSIRGIIASWSANDSTERVTGYRVYASTSPNVTFNSANIKYDGPGNLAWLPANDNETWYLFVTAYRTSFGVTYESGASTEVSATTITTQDDTIPPDVTGASARAETYYHGSTEFARIHLTWNPIVMDSLAGYVISWREQNDDWTEEQVGAGGSHFLLSGAQPGFQYRFRIKAITVAGNRSNEWTPEVIITPDTNGGAIREEVALTVGGAIESANFDVSIPRGFRLSSSSLEIYGTTDSPVSMVLGGGSGLNLNTLNNQLWFGGSTFNSATWRVDGAGNMRVGPAGAFYADQAGNIWSGHAVRSSAPWEVLADGSSRFDKVRITGDSLATNDYLLTAGNDFTVRKTSTGFHVTLGGNMDIVSGGNLRVTTGNITIGGGQLNLESGQFNMSGGSVNLTGAPVTLNGSNLTVVDGNIIVDGSAASSASPTGIIQSQNYSYSLKRGWAMDNGSLYLFDGAINASLINVQDGSNLVEHGYSTFSLGDAWFDAHMTSSGTAVTMSTTGVWSRYGGRALNLQRGVGSAFAWLSTSTSTYNIEVEPGEDYILSAYIYNNSTAAKSVRIRLRRSDGGGYLYTPTYSIPAGEVRRVSGVMSIPGTTPRVLVMVDALTDNSDLMIDGVQLEERIGDNTEPSAFKTGTTTTIHGGQITTGSIQSTPYTSTSGWSLPLSGNAVFGNGVFRGDIRAINGFLQNMDISGQLSVTSSGSILIGTTATGVEISSSGIVSRQSGAVNVNIPSSGAPQFKGAIQATSISIGAYTASSGGTAFNVDTSGRLFMGASSYSTNAPFNVSAAGVLRATGAVISGEINATSGTFTGNVTGSTISGGSISIGATNFNVNTSGQLYMGASSFASSPFRVTTAGFMTATTGSFGGDLNAAGGTFTGVLDIVASSGGVKIDPSHRNDIRLYRSLSSYTSIAYDASANRITLDGARGGAGNARVSGDNVSFWALNAYTFGPGADINFSNNIVTNFGENWITASRYSGWTNQGGNLETVGYRREGDKVFIKGVLSGGSGIIFRLPVGFRPAERSMHLVPTISDSMARVDVEPLGYVRHVWGNTSIVSLSGIVVHL